MTGESFALINKQGQLRESSASASALAEAAPDAGIAAPARLGARPTPEQRAAHEAFRAEINARFKESGEPSALRDGELDEIIRQCRREGRPVPWHKLHISSLHSLRMERGLHATEDRDLTPEESDEWREWACRHADS